MIGITASYINPMESENVYIALLLCPGGGAGGGLGGGGT